MKCVRSFDTQSGEYLGVLHASRVTPATRYSKGYRCLDSACDCSFHWRRAVDAKENTEHRAATFAKNPSSAHAPDCRYDFERIASENPEQTFYKGGQFHLRILFPLGSSKYDRFPMRPGYLRSRQIRAAHANVDKVGAPSVKEAVRFLEKQFGSLEDPGLGNLVLYYQGQSYDWEDTFVASDEYKKLIDKASKTDGLDRRDVALSVVRPIHEISPSQKGSRRFVCEPQYAKANYNTLDVKPILTCETPEIAEKVTEVMSKGQPLLVASRPFMPGTQRLGAPVQVYLHVHEPRQLSEISNDYWRIVPGTRHQADLFADYDTKVG